MLMRRLIALDNLKKTLPLIDEDQKLALLHTPYVRQGKSYNYSDRRGGYSRKSGGQGRGRGRSAPTATITKPGQPKEGHTNLTVSVLQDSNKQKAVLGDDTSQTPQNKKCHFRGRGPGNKKQQ